MLLEWSGVALQVATLEVFALHYTNKILLALQLILLWRYLAIEAAIPQILDQRALEYLVALSLAFLLAGCRIFALVVVQIAFLVMAKHRALFRRPIVASIAFGNRLHEHHTTLHELVAPLGSTMIDHLDVLLGGVLPYRWPGQLKFLQQRCTPIVGTPLILLMELVLII